MSKKIYINPGHGGHDSGAVGVGGRKEKDDTLRYGTRVAQLLTVQGFNVNLQRNDDSYISVTDIAKLANAWGADYFIAFHRNSGGGKGGAECLIVSNASAKSRELAQAIQDSLVANGFINRGVKVQDKNTYVLSHTKMPATTIEAGFVDIESDNILFDSKFESICTGIANAIASVADGSSNGGNEPTPAPEPNPNPSPSGFAVDRILKFTKPIMKGEDVASVQQALINSGFSVGGRGADGQFGENTETAVRKFQSSVNLKVDGIVGKNTVEALGGTWGGSSTGGGNTGGGSSSNAPVLTRNLKLTSPMMRGEDVRQAQERLEYHKAQPGKIDGTFGKNTKAAVIRFQKARIAEGHDLGSSGADGVIGQKTWNLLW